ncbi:hypothetical protein BDV12DRAFT_198169 [Aspergillus spectabilis]
MAPQIRTSISGISKDVAPGATIQGTVQIQTAEPLALTELALTLNGHGSSRIFRELSIALFPLHARWNGKVTFCERVLVLVDQPTTLPAGTHQFPFQLHIPETTEILPEAQVQERRKEWQQNPLFVGVKKTHPLPPSLKVTSKVDQGNKWVTPPSCVQALTMSGPVTKPKPADEIKWIHLSQELSRKHPAVTVSIQLPATITQLSPLDVRLSVNKPGFKLISLKAKLFTGFAVRGRSAFLSDNASPANSVEKLLAWEGDRELVPYVPQLVQSSSVSSAKAVVKFATLNVVCVEHQLEVKYKLQDNNGKIVAGIFPNFLVDVQGPN